MRRLILMLTAALAPLAAGAQTPLPDLAADLRAHTFPITLERGRLTGPGAALILDAAEKSQFVAIGEEHNDRSIPQFATSIFRHLHEKSGFNYLAEEQDPAMMRTISTAPVRGNLKEIQALAQRYKLGFTFISDEELEMLGAVGGISTGRGRPVWGCEQAFGITHVLDRVAAKAPNKAAARLVAKLRKESAAGEAERDLTAGHFIARPELSSDLQSLKQLYATANADTRFLVDSLGKSNEIYVEHERQTPGAPGRFAANSSREEYMKSVCRAEYLYARSRDHREPKVLLKFGQNHLFEQWGPNGFSTLGNFFANLARWNGTRYTSIAVFYSSIKGQPSWTNRNLTFLRAFKDVVPANSPMVIDLRSLRDGPAHDALFSSVADLDQGQRQELSGLIYGFDFLLMIGPSTRASFEVTRVKY